MESGRKSYKGPKRRSESGNQGVPGPKLRERSHTVFFGGGPPLVRPAFKKKGRGEGKEGAERGRPFSLSNAASGGGEGRLKRKGERNELSSRDIGRGRGSY